MNGQALFDIVLALAGAFGGIILKSIHAEIKDLREKQHTQNQKIADVEILVAGAYVTRLEMTQLMSTVFAKLDKISDKLDAKADR